MQQTVLWLKTWTAVWVLFTLAAAFIGGIVLRVLVKNTTLHPSHALRVIGIIAVIVGGGIGSVVVLLLLIILWPEAGNWVINTFLSVTLIWQTELQQWITQKISDPMTSSAIGLLIQRMYDLPVDDQQSGRCRVRFVHSPVHRKAEMLSLHPQD